MKEDFHERLIQDLRYARRQLPKNGGFASTVLIVLALGIGSLVVTAVALLLIAVALLAGFRPGAPRKSTRRLR